MKKLNRLSLKQRAELFRQLRISITHHSNAMEGTTLSFGETKELLELGHTAGHKSLGEQLVILGFAKAYDVIVREATNKENIIDSSFIKDIHAIMFEDALKIAPEYVSKPIGAYRLDERYIKGVDIKLSAPNKISNDIENLLYRFNSNNMNLKDIAEFHILFERVHPFADGNGRVGRLLMAFQAIQNNIVPPLIQNENRTEYLTAINDKDELLKFIDESIQNSMALLE
ncbi:MAG TPA: Fic family protein [Campylobacterales bacterium]|nr:Fic family protein [Campylobacterales bacterium]HHD81119.1 Fic family protein [Campylobacterales bacterium]HHH53602.1 Fic family protein [Bacteroidota bacterium]